jgi:hypothetical protein
VFPGDVCLKTPSKNYQSSVISPGNQGPFDKQPLSSRPERSVVERSLHFVFALALAVAFAVAVAVAFAVALAFLSVIPEGNLLLAAARPPLPQSNACSASNGLALTTYYLLVTTSSSQ